MSYTSSAIILAHCLIIQAFTAVLKFNLKRFFKTAP